MPSLKIVSSAEGLKLLKRNRFDGSFGKIMCHYCDSSENSSTIMNYHAMFKELNDKKRVINIASVPKNSAPPWYESVLFHTPVHYGKYLWSNTRTVGVSMNDALQLDAIRRKQYSGILVFAPHPISMILYRLYKQIVDVIGYDLSIVVVRTKLDKSISWAYDFQSQIETLAKNSIFGGYGANRILKFNGVYLNKRIILNPANPNKLTADSCRAPTETEKDV